MTTPRNPVAEAFEKLGGVTMAVVRTGGRWSETTLHRWKRAGAIPDIEAAFAFQDLTGIEARVLGGLPPAARRPMGSNGDARRATGTDSTRS